MLSTSQQVGGSIGTALLNTIAASSTATWLATRATTGAGAANEAAVHGYVTAFWWALGIVLLAAALVAALVDQQPASTNSADTDAPPAPVPAH